MSAPGTVKHASGIRRAGVSAALLVLLILPEFIVGDFLVREIEGVNSYNTHRAFYGERTVGQTLQWPDRRISAIGLWLGRMRRDADLRGDVILRIRGSPGVPNEFAPRILRGAPLGASPILREVALPLADIRFSELTFFRFPPIPEVKGSTISIELTAPETTDMSALGVRIDPDGNPEPTGRLYRNRLAQSEGEDLAFQLVRRGGQWSRLGAALDRDQLLRKTLANAALVSVVLVLFAWIAGRRRQWIDAHPRAEWLTVGALLALLLIARLTIARDVRAVPSGDPYNFAFIAGGLLRGQNPYEGTKRLPGYPLLVMPGQVLTDDTLQIGRVVNQGAIVLAAGALYALARRVGMTPTGAAASAAAFSFMRDVIFVPLHPLSYPLFTFQVLAALLLYPFARMHAGRAVVLGVLLGWMAQTRHEGFVLAGALLLALIASGIWKWSRRHASARRSFAPAGATLAVFTLLQLPFIITTTKVYGKPFYSEYIDAPVTNVHRSASELRQHAGQTYAVFSSLWWPAWTQQIRLGPDRMLGSVFISIAVFGAARWWAQSRASPGFRTTSGRGFLVASTVGTLFLLLWMGEDRTMVLRITSAALASASVWGWTLFLFRFRWPAAGVLCSALLLAIPPFWVHPYAKNFLHVMPFVALGLGMALEWMLLPRAVKPRWREDIPWALQGALAILLISIPIVSLSDGLPGMIERHNAKYLDDTLVREAAIAARRLTPDEHLGLQHLFLPVLAFFDASRTHERHRNDPTPLEEWARVRNIRALLWRSNDTVFPEVTERSERFPVLFETTGTQTNGQTHTVRLLGLPL